MPKQRLMEEAMAILYEKGKEATRLAKDEIRREELTFKPLQEALEYFIKEWNDFLHPGLASLACEAVGGKANSTVRIGAALVLLAGGADIHDDIIDQSMVKEPKQTVFGKFGKDVALLAGNAFLLKGIYLLHDACDVLSKPNRVEILEIVKNAFFESSSAEAEEASLRGRSDISLNTFLKIIEHKVATAEASTRIGAVFGNGKRQEIDFLGHFGRTYGKIMALRDEFIDIYEIDELNNRINKEILPLPLLLVLKEESSRSEISRLIEEPITEEKIQQILDVTLGFKHVQHLLTFMKSTVLEEVTELKKAIVCKESLEKILSATLEDL